MASILAGSSAAHAQQSGKVQRIGFIGSLSTPSVMRSTLQPLLVALHDLGYDEGRNVTLEFRSAEGHTERMPDVAAELVALHAAIAFRPRRRGHRVNPKHPLGPPMTLGNMRKKRRTCS